MNEKDRFGIANEYISLPEEVTAENIARLSHYLKNGKGFAESAALCILEEAREMSRQEMNKWQASGGEIDFAGNKFISWEGYRTPAYAFLNAVELLRSGRPFQIPEEDEGLSLKIFDMELMGEFWRDHGINVDMEPVVITDIAEWHIKQAGRLDTLLKDNNPLDFIDAIVDGEKRKLSDSSRKEKKEKNCLGAGRIKIQKSLRSCGAY